MNIPGATGTGGGDAPEVEDGLYVAEFVGITTRVVEAFKTEKDKFGHPDDGTRIDFNFALLDEDGNRVLKDEEDPDSGDLILRQAKSVKEMTTGERSNCYAVIKGILTPAELALWVQTGPGKDAENAAWEAAAAKIESRRVNVQVSHSSTGWPQIEATLGPVKAKAAK